MVDVKDLLRRYEDAWNDASEWVSDARDLVDFIAPGRGVLDRHNRPKKRRLHSEYILNDAAGDAIGVFASGLHGRLTGPSRQWFQLKFDEDTPAGDALKRWMNDNQRRMHSAFHRSNFYEQMPGYYEEWGIFGNASMFQGDDDEKVFNFNTMTFGEFVFTLRGNGKTDYFFRDIWLTPRQMRQLYGERNLPESIKTALQRKKDSNTFYKVVNAVYEEKFRDKDFTSVHMLYANPSTNSRTGVEGKPLKVEGFYEFPFATSRYSVIGSDALGIGLGSKIINDAKRLQEMEKAALMAVHKSVSPALNVPPHLKNKVQILPNGINYKSQSGDKIEPIENRAFEYSGVGATIERTEMRIKKACFNDVFLTGMRDPNASPLKAAQVNRMEDEEIIKLGPAIGRLYSEALMPIIQRAFNSMLRRGLFEDIDPDMLEAAGKFKIVLIGPLAQMQKLIEARSIQTFFSFVGGVMQFDETARDKINVDSTIDEFADITGVPMSVLNDEKTVQGIRDSRMKKMQAKQQQEQQLQGQAMGLQAEKEKSEIAKNYAEAGEAGQPVLQGAM